MNIRAECVSCMLDQIRKALILLDANIANDEIVDAQKSIMVKFGNLKEKSTPYYGQLIYRSIGEFLGNDDPYKMLKKQYNEIADSFTLQLKDKITNSENPFLEALNISILGNCIDFGTPHQIDLGKEINNYSIDNLAINHFDQLLKDFNDENKKNVLIIGDNTGEIIFDKLLLEYLVLFCPKKKITYAVRGGPAINDATIQDAKEYGITDICDVVEGSHSPGVIMEQVSEEFKAAFDSADIILSKGQGNFESLDNVPANCDVYFMLKTKCPLVAGMFNVPLGSLVLHHRKSIYEFS